MTLIYAYRHEQRSTLVATDLLVTHKIVRLDGSIIGQHLFINKLQPTLSGNMFAYRGSLTLGEIEQLANISEVRGLSGSVTDIFGIGNFLGKPVALLYVHLDDGSVYLGDISKPLAQLGVGYEAVLGTYAQATALHQITVHNLPDSTMSITKLSEQVEDYFIENALADNNQAGFASYLLRDGKVESLKKSLRGLEYVTPAGAAYPRTIPAA